MMSLSHHHHYPFTGRSVTCVSCPPGYYCPRIDLAEVLACDLGTYSVGGQASCTTCPAGRLDLCVLTQ